MATTVSLLLNCGRPDYDPAAFDQGGITARLAQLTPDTVSDEGKPPTGDRARHGGARRLTAEDVAVCTCGQ